MKKRRGRRARGIGRKRVVWWEGGIGMNGMVKRNGGKGEVGRNGGVGWKEGIGRERGIGRNGGVGKNEGLEKRRCSINGGIGKNKVLDGKEATKERRDRNERRGGIREEVIGGNWDFRRNRGVGKGRVEKKGREGGREADKKRRGES